MKKKNNTETQSDAVMDGDQLRTLEAILFAASEPLAQDVLADRLGEKADIPTLLAALKEQYAARGINLVNIDGEWSFRTAPDLASALQIYTQPRRKLPRVAAETLAIIAYHQPITRAEIESIRGVQVSSETLAQLLELGWVRPGKRRETPGRPITWMTAPDFLSHFNMPSLNELPGLEELKAAGLLDSRPVLDTMPVSQDDSALGDNAGTWNEEDNHLLPAANA